MFSKALTRAKAVIMLLGAAWLVAAAHPALAVIETYEFSQPELEQRYHQLSFELRCPKCQNQNIADSNAPISQDLRRLLHQQLEAGATDDEILDYIVARYGECARYRPRFAGATVAVWLSPSRLPARALVGGGTWTADQLRLAGVRRRPVGAPGGQVAD